MITFFSHTLPCRWALLEYSEGQAIEDFDLSIPLNPQVIEQIIKPRYPDLVDKLSELCVKDPGSGVMLDAFSKETVQPAVVSFRDPEGFLADWGAEGALDDSKEFYAAVVYPARDNLVRLVYRNAETPKVKTDVHSGDGTFSHHEEIYKGELPASLSWAESKLQELKDAGVNARINHFKDLGADSKVYFLVEANG
jgi:hypothetical protein